MFPAALVPGRACADTYDEQTADDNHEHSAQAPRPIGDHHPHRMPDLAPGGEYRSALRVQGYIAALQPVAPSTAHTRGANSAAQHNSRSRCRRSARTNSSPTSRSSPSIATAVCEPLCGSSPMMNTCPPPSQMIAAAGTPDAGMPFLFRATPQHGNRRADSSLRSQPEAAGHHRDHPPAPSTLRTTAARDTNSTIRAICARGADRYSLEFAAGSGMR